MSTPITAIVNVIDGTQWSEASTLKEASEEFVLLKHHSGVIVGLVPSTRGMQGFNGFTIVYASAPRGELMSVDVSKGDVKGVIENLRKTLAIAHYDDDDYDIHVQRLHDWFASKSAHMREIPIIIRVLPTAGYVPVPVNPGVAVPVTPQHDEIKMIPLSDDAKEDLIVSPEESERSATSKKRLTVDDSTKRTSKRPARLGEYELNTTALGTTSVIKK